MCFGKIKHFYYVKLDILCFLELNLKADNNNLCTVTFSIHTNKSALTGQTVRSVHVIYSGDSQQLDNHLSDLNNLMNFHNILL